MVAPPLLVLQVDSNVLIDVAGELVSNVSWRGNAYISTLSLDIWYGYMVYIHWLMIYDLCYIYMHVYIYIYSKEAVDYTIMFNFICSIVLYRHAQVPRYCQHTLADSKVLHMELSCITSPGMLFQSFSVLGVYSWYVWLFCLLFGCLSSPLLSSTPHRTTPACAGSLLELKLQEGRWQLFVDNQSVAPHGTSNGKYLMLAGADLRIYSDCCIIVYYGHWFAALIAKCSLSCY